MTYVNYNIIYAVLYFNVFRMVFANDIVPDGLIKWPMLSIRDAVLKMHLNLYSTYYIKF